MLNIDQLYKLKNSSIKFSKYIFSTLPHLLSLSLLLEWNTGLVKNETLCFKILVCHRVLCVAELLSLEVESLKETLLLMGKWTVVGVVFLEFLSLYISPMLFSSEYWQSPVTDTEWTTLCLRDLVSWLDSDCSGTTASRLFCESSSTLWVSFSRFGFTFDCIIFPSRDILDRKAHAAEIRRDFLRLCDVFPCAATVAIFGVEKKEAGC